MGLFCPLLNFSNCCFMEEIKFACVYGTREVFQWLKTLVPLSDDLGLIASTNMGAHKHV